jgi:hypothetical protein
MKALQTSLSFALQYFGFVVAMGVMNLLILKVNYFFKHGCISWTILGHSSDGEYDHPMSDSAELSGKRKRKVVGGEKRRKKQKSKGKARATSSDSDSETYFGIQVTEGKTKQRGGGMHVDEVVYISTPECWDSHQRITESPMFSISASLQTVFNPPRSNFLLTHSSRNK